MSDTRILVAARVRAQLISAERSNEKSIAEGARFVASLADAGLTIHAALEVGHAVIEEAFAGLAANIESRRRYLAAHLGLVDVAERIGVELATGGGASKRAKDFATSAETNIVEIGKGTSLP